MTAHCSKCHMDLDVGDHCGAACPLRPRPDRFALQAELNRRHNLREVADIRGGWREFNHACFEVRRRLLGIDGPRSWGGSVTETQARLIRYIMAHRLYPNPRLP